MKLAVCVQTDEVPRALPVALFSGPLAERAQKAADAGADGLELMTVDPAQLDAAAVRRTVAGCRLAVAAVGSGGIASITGLTLLHADPTVAGAARDRLHRLIEFAAEAGAPLVTVGSLRGRAAGDPAARDRLAAVLTDAADRGRALGVRLAVEAVNRYELDLLNTADETLAFLAEIGHPGIGLLLDTFHMNIEESSWTAPLRRALDAGRLYHVHLGDNNRLPPGDGLIDFAAIVNTLYDSGYDGYLSAELLARPDPDTAGTRTLAHMRRLLTALGARRLKSRLPLRSLPSETRVV